MKLRQQPEPEERRRDVVEAIGQADTFLEFGERLSHVAQVERPVLLIGERGTGKELAAQRLHYLSKRWEGPFVTLNCAALAPTLLESELFGHEAGAFTGAGTRRQGRFEAADTGTFFLDEIGNIPLEAQAKILRVVEYGTFERVGSSQPTQVNVRIVAATNADLQAKSDSGEFMRDLLDRLSFDVLLLPALRERREDIAILANHFSSRMAAELGWPDVPTITEDAMTTMEAYSWPGNVRELKNVIERAVYRSGDHVITRDELIFDPFRPYSRVLQGPRTPHAPDTADRVVPRDEDADDEDVDISAGFESLVNGLEVKLLRQALETCKYNQRKAADYLKLTYHQFRGLYRKYAEQFDE